jgi:hypothetical protein
MTRVLLTVILPLIAPTALYVLWSLTFSKAEAASQVRLPIAWLALAGALLAAGILVIVVQFGGGGEGVYVPPHLSNGDIVPGHIEPER